MAEILEQNQVVTEELNANLTEGVETETNGQEGQATEAQETDIFDIDLEYLKSIKVDEEEEQETEQKQQEALKQKDVEAFKTLRLEKETALKETAAERKTRLELEEKIKLITKELAENIDGFHGDEEAAQRFINKAVEKQTLKLKGYTPEAIKRMEAIEEENAALKREKAERERNENEKFVYNTAQSKLESVLNDPLLKTNFNELEKSLKAYEKYTGLKIIGNTELIANISPNLIKEAVVKFRKSINPNLVNKNVSNQTQKQQTSGSVSEEERIKNLAKQVEDALNSR